MDEQQTLRKRAVSQMPDQWVTDRYCKELLKLKAKFHFQGKIDLGQADIDLMRCCKEELQHRKLIVPHINFRVRA
jgi:hypothetical protein